MGTPLLRRVGRGIELSEAGQTFHKDAVAILDQIRIAVVRAKEVGRGARGHIVVGITEAAGFSAPVTKLFGRLKKEQPNVSLTFLQGNTSDLLTALDEHKVDAVIVCPPVPAPSRFDHLPFLSESVLVALPKHHALAGRKAISLDDLREQPLIFHNDGAERRYFETAFRDACLEHGFLPIVAQETPELILALNLVAAGVGITFVPKSVRGVRTHEIIYCKLQTTPALLHLLTVVTRFREPSPAVVNFLSLARLCAKT